MSSPFFSELTKLDGSLRTIQAQVDRLRSGLDDNEDQLKQNLAEASQHASALRDLLRAENADAKWSDREALEHLILALEIAADEKRVQQRRTKLLELASELEAGSLKHRSSARAESLNALRVKAVTQLRDLAARKEQEKELPGPEASQWVHWVCNLEEENDAAALADLRENYAALDELAASIEESFWVPGQRAAVTVPPLETTTPKAESSAAPKRQPSAVAEVKPQTSTMTDPGATTTTTVAPVPASEAPAVTKTEPPAAAAVKPGAPSRVRPSRLPQEVRAHFDKAVHTGDFSEALSLCYDQAASETASVSQSAAPAEEKATQQPSAAVAGKEPQSPTEATPPPLKYCAECGRTFPNRYKVCPFDSSALQDLPDAAEETANTVGLPVEPLAPAIMKREASAAKTAAAEKKTITSEQAPKPPEESSTEGPQEQTLVPVPEFGSASSSFGELTLSKKPPVATWVAAAVLVVVCAVFLWMHFRGSNSAKAASALPNTASNADSEAANQPKTLLHREAAEGAQDNILLSMENCEHANPGGIECWGYISNQRDKDSKISLYRVNAIDGKGNSFDLSSKGHATFSDIHDFTVPAQSKVKYSIKVPDNDKDARTLTLYLDISNPHGSEYTFRDVPVSD